jgi:tetratricopeptide (TPR) repeat protein
MPWAALANNARTVWPADYARSLELTDRAIAADPKNATAYLWRGISCLELGFFARAIADFDRCAHLYLWLGDFDRAAATDDSLTGEYVTWDSYPPGFRNSPGFKHKHKLERSGVLAYWRPHGFPPQCHPVGKQDFECD